MYPVMVIMPLLVMYVKLVEEVGGKAAICGPEPTTGTLFMLVAISVGVNVPVVV
jgi:hypothetical protein